MIPGSGAFVPKRNDFGPVPEILCVEYSHIIPAIERLEKITRTLEVPLYEFFYDAEGPRKASTRIDLNTTTSDARRLSRSRDYCS